MKAWLIYIIVQGGVVAAAAAGLNLHLRLVRFFDLGWALWAISTAFISVYLTIWFSSPLLGIAMGGLIGMLLGIFEDGFVFRNVLTSFIPNEAIERYLFSGALAAYLAIASLIEVFGLRDQATIPATENYYLGLSLTEFTVAACCWGIIATCALIRILPWSLPIRALLEDSHTCSSYGMPVLILATIVGGLSGLLTGIAASCFGLLYFAHSSSGFSLMLIAIIPCILIGPRHSFLVVFVGVITIAIIGGIRFYIGYTASEFVIQGLIIILLLARPNGFVGGRLREL